MCDGVYTRCCRDIFWHTFGQRGIENNTVKPRFQIAAGHLDMRFCIGNKRVRLRFAPRARSRWNPDRRQHGFCRMAHTQIIFHLSAICQDKIDPLGAIHRTAPTHPDDQINIPLCFCKRNTGLYMRGRGVFTHTVKHKKIQGSALKHRNRTACKPGTYNPWICHKKNAVSAQFF